MESFVKFTNQSQGRDRLFRATQYACMLLSYVLENKAGREKVVMKLKRVESNMSSGRKLFRLGNVVHAIEASKASIQLPDAVLCYCLTAANLNRLLYFTCDTVLWVRSVDLVSDINKEKWRHRASLCYLYSLLFQLARDFYELINCMEKEKTCRRKGANHENGLALNSSNTLLKSLENYFFILGLSLKNHPALLLDTIKNVCDLFSPLDQLGFYKTNPGFIGISGLVSSIVGIMTAANPQLKLKN
ncbi:peroxisomal membrane protein 11A [Bufo gargarizans]|uniref:peroxisomal membrane protein 11A n=1 Tax=Bufo gargarizans TaxID=30331 RepID=UPI001CF2B365|nr:peroxisomal membrane protein 11A [Bufo gargarizans]XP_044135422.1 peroxisomal membrane protein 11A [Bufo gargarizans]XP_044135423.1 peroxisomal membrane protein 11A [Bufo gargarizans]XP_044135425.1 peroxisomal membrane protein 11A [Bufo gargarizans]